MTSASRLGEAPDTDAPRVRRAISDLVALSTVPAAWVGREPAAIAAGLADVLVNSLHLDFAFVRLCDPAGVRRWKSLGGAHGEHSRNGCSLISPSTAACRAARSSATLAPARSNAAVLSFRSALVPREAWLRRRAITPPFPAKLTSCCSP